MNKAILMGRLTRDPEIRYSQAAEPLCIARFTVACDRRFKRDSEDSTDFIGCVAFGKTGEFIEKYFKKGMKISVIGRIQVRQWEDNSGQKRWTTEVVCEEVEFVESKAAADQIRNSQPAQQNQPAHNNQPDDFYNVEESVEDDSLPFF